MAVYFAPKVPSKGAQYAELLASILQQERESRAQQTAARSKQEQDYLDRIAADVSRLPGPQRQTAMASLPTDVQEKLKARGNFLIDTTTPDDTFHQKVVADASSRFDTLPPETRNAGTYQLGYGAQQPKELTETDIARFNMTPQDFATRGRVDAGIEMNAKDAADARFKQTKYEQIDKPESVATIGKTTAETRKYGAEVGRVGAEVALLNAKRNALQKAGVDPDTAGAPLPVSGTKPPLEQAPAVVRLLVNRDYDPALLRRWKPEQIEAALKEVLTYDEHFSMQDYAAEVQAKKDFTSGKESQNIKAINTAIHHIETASNAAEKLHNRSFTPWNTVANKATEVFGGSSPVEFRTAMQNALTPEMAAVFKGAGATDQEIHSWRTVASSSSSPEQIHAVLARMAELMAGRTKGIINKWHVAFNHGPNPKPVPKFIGEGEKAILKKYGFEVGDEGTGGSPTASGDGNRVLSYEEALKVLSRP